MNRRGSRSGFGGLNPHFFRQFCSKKVKNEEFANLQLEPPFSVEKFVQWNSPFSVSGTPIFFKILDTRLNEKITKLSFEHMKKENRSVYLSPAKLFSHGFMGEQVLLYFFFRLKPHLLFFL